jgi:hypothetical protein
MSMPTLRKHDVHHHIPVSPVASSTFEVLNDISAIGPDDHVAIIGHHTLDSLLGLVRNGCSNVAAARPDYPCHLAETADIVWITDVPAFDAEIVAIIRGLAAARVVAVTVAHGQATDRLPGLFDLLRAKGLTTVTTHAVTGGTVIVASRPAWLRQIIH